MSEYWVSKKKYFCKTCDIYIADDAPSRQLHENGMRHKGNTERFIRGLYKTSEKRKKDLDEEKRDMARVEQAAQAAFAQDVVAGIAKFTSAPVASTSATIRKPAVKPSNPFTNYSTAESLGFQDPDAERYAAETERRRTQGVAGNWELISSPLPLPTASTPGTSEPDPGDTTLKREADTSIDEEDSRQFKLRKKTLSTGLGEIYDPGVIPIKLKKKEDPVVSLQEAAPSTSLPTGAPKWTKVQWKHPGETVKPEESTDTTTSGVNDDASDEKSSQVADEVPPRRSPEIKPEEIAPALSTTEPINSMFRKRKVPSGGNRGKRQI